MAKPLPRVNLGIDTYQIRFGRTADAFQAQNPNQPNRNGATAFHEAVQAGNVGVVFTMLQQGANPWAVDNSGLTTLHRAATSGNPAMVQTILSLGLNPNQPNQYGVTPFHSAVLKGNLRSVELLRQHGANPRSVDRYGVSTLHRAAMAEPDNPAMVAYLLKLGLNPNQRDTSDWNTPLHEAAICGNVNAIRTLLQAGATSSINRNNQTPYQLAAEEGHISAAILLCPGRRGILARRLYTFNLEPAKHLAARIAQVNPNPLSAQLNDETVPNMLNAYFNAPNAHPTP